MDTEPTTWTVTVVVPEQSTLDGAGERHEIEVAENQYILSAARARGVWLPADCQQGWCITCAARLLDGEVDQSDARRYYDDDRRAGYVLPCTAKPRSDVTIEAEAYDDLLEVRAAHDRPPGNSKLG